MIKKGRECATISIIECRYSFKLEENTMAKNMEYAKLSKLVSKFDGPKLMVKSIESFEKNLYQKGYKAGKAEERRKKYIYAAVGIAVGAAAVYAYQYYQQKKLEEEALSADYEDLDEE